MKAGRESTAVRNRGGGEKMREAVAGSETEGLDELLRGVTSHSHPLPSQPPSKKPHHAPSATISQPPPQESTGPKVSDPAGQAYRTCFSSCSLSFRGGHSSPHETPQNSGWGIKWVYKCQVEDCKEGPSTPWATICAHVRKVHLGVRLVCSLCGKTFFNLDVLRCHKKVTSINKIREIITWEYIDFGE